MTERLAPLRDPAASSNHLSKENHRPPTVIYWAALVSAIWTLVLLDRSYSPEALYCTSGCSEPGWAFNLPLFLFPLATGVLLPLNAHWSAQMLASVATIGVSFLLIAIGSYLLEPDEKLFFLLFYGVLAVVGSLLGFLLVFMGAIMRSIWHQARGR